MNMRINTGSLQLYAWRKRSATDASQAQRQSATKCLQNHVCQGVPEIGSEWGTGKICAWMISASTRKGNDHSYWGLEGPGTSPRDCVFPTCQSTELAAVFCQCEPAEPFPSGTRELLLFNLFLTDRKEISKDQFSARQKGTWSYWEMMSQICS